MSSIDWRVHTTLLFVQTTFGLFHVTAKIVLGTLPPLALAGIRVICATPLLLLMAWMMDRTLPRWRDLPFLAMLGLFGVFGNQLMFIIGLQRTRAVDASILMTSIPVFAVAIGGLAGVERMATGKWLGVLLAVSGALVMLDPLGFSVSRDNIIGNILVLANCASFATFLVLQKPLLRRLPPLTVVAWSFFFGGLGIVAVSTTTLLEVRVESISSVVLAALAFIVLVPTALNYALNAWSIRRSSPSLVATYTTLQPLTGSCAAYFLLGERLYWRELIGFVLIVGGLVLVSHLRSLEVAPSALPGPAVSRE
jgi:drug/metabolite transporter (DMT)-like permease